MNNFINLIKDILVDGEDVSSRAGNARVLTHQTLSFDLRETFPRITNRYVPFKSVAVELEGFIGGITSKKWYQDRGCKFWDDWANPIAVDKSIIKWQEDNALWIRTGKQLVLKSLLEKPRLQAECDDLGPVYGWQWRRFGQQYLNIPIEDKIFPEDSKDDQLNTILRTLLRNPSDRRMRCSSVCPKLENQMALPACHDYWKVDVVNGNLDLFFHMRSWDVYLGGPANIQSYAILAHLLAEHAGLKARKITVFASNAHLYENLIPQCEELISRPQPDLPTVEFSHDGFWDWDHSKIKCVGYNHSGKLSANVSV